MKHFVAALFAFTILIGASGTAWAGLEICNQTDEIVFTSVAQELGDEMVVRGWWEIAPQSCRTVVGDTSSNRYYYVHAFTATLSAFWTMNSDSRLFCTLNEPFEFRGFVPCTEREAGQRIRRFFRIDIGAPGARYTLNLR